MTNELEKQIIIYKKECYNEPHCSLNQVLEQLKTKEQECEELKKDLHQNFKEKDELHLIIDRLLEASGYDTNTASAEDFEDVYEHMRYEQQQLDQLKAENDELKKQHQGDKGLITSTGKMNYQLIQEYDKLKTENERLKETFDSLFKVQYKLADNNKKLRQCLTEIKEIIHFNKTNRISGGAYISIEQILQKISECEVLND